MAKRKKTKQPHKGWKAAASKRHEKPKCDPLRNNPVVGWMNEGQAESILADIRDEKRRGVW